MHYSRSYTPFKFWEGEGVIWGEGEDGKLLLSYKGIVPMLIPH